MIELSIVIPCYNEEKSLPNLFSVCREAGGARPEVEFIFVNNGSTDGSKAVFAKLLEEPGNSFATVFNVPVNKGYGYGILQGLFHAKGDVISWTHADLQTDPVDVINAYRQFKSELLNRSCIVKGERTGRNPFDFLFTFGMSVFASIALRQTLSDINAQPKIFHKDFLKELENAPHDFSLDLYLLYTFAKKGITIRTFPVVFGKRHFGEAKGGGTFKGKIKLVKRTIHMIRELRRSMKKSG